MVVKSARALRGSRRILRRLWMSRRHLAWRPSRLLSPLSVLWKVVRRCRMRGLPQGNGLNTVDNCKRISSC